MWRAVDRPGEVAELNHCDDSRPSSTQGVMSILVRMHRLFACRLQGEIAANAATRAGAVIQNGYMQRLFWTCNSSFVLCESWC